MSHIIDVTGVQSVAMSFFMNNINITTLSLYIYICFYVRPLLFYWESDCNIVIRFSVGIAYAFWPRKLHNIKQEGIEKEEGNRWGGENVKGGNLWGKTSREMKKIKKNKNKRKEK